VTDSSLPGSLKELQPPDNWLEIERTFEGYRAVLQGMKPAELMEQLTKINAAIETENRMFLQQAISPPLSEFTSTLDQPVLRSRSTARPSPLPRDRGAAASRPEPSQRQSPLDLLFGSTRGRRLAGKLVAANARSINGSRRR